MSLALSLIALSVENSVTTTPRLNPIPSTSDNAILAANVTVPVPWSTVKNLPTRKKPSWSVLTKNTLPLLRSFTSLVWLASLAGKPKITFG